MNCSTVFTAWKFGLLRILFFTLPSVQVFIVLRIAERFANVVLQLLNALQMFGSSLDDYLHLLVPPVVKLFDSPDIPHSVRK